MNTSLLYVITVIIWGSTWLAIKFQIGSVAPEVSVAYRFALASLVLIGYCALTGRRLRYGWRDHAFMALQGVLMFSVNYLLFYWATKYLTTGLLAVIFSSIIFMNILGRVFFFGELVQRQVATSAVLGLTGIVLVFWHEFTSFNLSHEGVIGAAVGLVATVFASLGNITSVRNQRHGLPVVQINAFGMAYGAAFMALVAIANGNPFVFDPSLSYVFSLLYLALFGSVFAFGCYLTLLGRIGADRAAYANVLFPIIALGLSTLFEGFQWSGEALAGVALVLIGNLLALVNFRVLLKRFQG